MQSYKIIVRKLLLLLCFFIVLSACDSEEDKAFTIAKYPESIVLKHRSDNGYGSLQGKGFESLRNQAGADYENLRIRKSGYFFLLHINDAELVDWRYLEGASINAIKIKGKFIPPEAWRWLRTLKDFNDDLTIELTDQPLDDAFYNELNGLLEGRKMDRIGIHIAAFNVCRIKFLDTIKGLTVMKQNVTEPPFVALERLKKEVLEADELNKVLQKHWNKSYQQYSQDGIAKTINQATISSLLDLRC